MNKKWATDILSDITSYSITTNDLACIPIPLQFVKAPQIVVIHNYFKCLIIKRALKDGSLIA